MIPDTGLEGGREVAEKVRDAVRAMRLPHGASRVLEHVTISLGLATCEPASGGTEQALVEAADRMLYAAKEGGRDRVGSA